MNNITVPNPFFLSRNTQPHVGDRIEFATHPNRSLSIEEAAQLAAFLVFLVDDDRKIGDLIEALRDHTHAAKHLGVPVGDGGRSARQAQAVASSASGQLGAASPAKDLQQSSSSDSEKQSA